MSIASSVVSVVLKSAVGDRFGSGLFNELAGIAIGEVSDKGINEITDFINEKKSKIDSILSKENLKFLGIPENKIAYVVTEIKELLSKIDITDEVLRQCRYDSMNLSAFLCNEYKKRKNDHIEYESEIKRCLFAVAKALIKLVRESEKFEKDVLIQISNSVDDANAEVQKVSDNLKKNFSKIDDNSQLVLSILLMILEQIRKMNMQDNKVKSRGNEAKKFQNDKKKEYIENWESRLFLHIDNEENPLTLADTFIMPDCINQKSIQEIGNYGSDTLDIMISKFIKYNKTLTMLVTGVPGIGKTSITSWIANEYKDDDRVIVLRFRDWKRKEIEEGLVNAICNRLCCENEDLENKILIIDGFDEMKALDIREKLLNDFVSEIKDFENFKCIITSRPAYINSSYFQVVVQVIEFDEKQIAIFYKQIKRNNTINIKKVRSNLEVLGIPVILYMAIMSDIDISKNSTKPELYNRIFAEKGGIFDKFFDGKRQYSKGLQIMRNPDNIKEYLKFLRKLAFRMFEMNNLSLDLEGLEIPQLDFEREKVSILEFPIKHFFESTEMNIEFIHKSIYDYFVSEYIFKSMNDRIKNSNHVDQNAGVMGELLKSNILSPDIIEFLKYKIRTQNIKEKFNILNQTFRLMLRDGMTYYTEKRCRDVIKCEKNVFANMLEILHIWNYHNLIEDAFIGKYLKSGGDVLNLQGMNLSKMNLREIELRNLNLVKTQMEGVDLENINFEGKNLMGIIWKKANLIGANLNGANLTDANLENADLTQANLSKAILMNSKLVRADLIGANLQEASLMKADLTEASLYMANLINVKLDNTNFYNANINYSIWGEREICKILSKLKNTVFKYIVIENVNGVRKEMCRQELFSRYLNY